MPQVLFKKMHPHLREEILKRLAVVDVGFTILSVQ